MTTQPEALRLADELDGMAVNEFYEALGDEAATELRRQHGEIESLRAERLRTEHRLSEVEAQRDALLEAFNGFAIPKDIEANITEKYEFIYYLVKFAQEQERERSIQFLQEMQRQVGDAHNHYGHAAVRIKGQHMTLPNDVARCAGTHRQECKDCLRRTSPSNSDRQVWIGVWVLPEPCESRIPPPKPA